MHTQNDILSKVIELTSTIQSAKQITQSQAQDCALEFSSRIVSVSQVIVLLIENDAPNEAHVICRLLLEHFFNFSALLNDESHYEVLQAHSSVEPTRQLKKILSDEKTTPKLTPANFEKTLAYIEHPDREKEQKTRLNWKDISRSGGTDNLYVAYSLYSFFYAHSTLASLVTQVSEQQIAELLENTWSILEVTNLMIKKDILKATQPN